MSVPREDLGDYPGVKVWREVTPGWYTPAEPLRSVRVFTAEEGRRKAKVWIGAMLIFGVALGVSLAVGPGWLQWLMLPWAVCLMRGSYWTGRERGIRDGI